MRLLWLWLRTDHNDAEGCWRFAKFTNLSNSALRTGSKPNWFNTLRNSRLIILLSLTRKTKLVLLDANRNYKPLETNGKINFINPIKNLINPHLTNIYSKPRSRGLSLRYNSLFPPEKTGIVTTWTYTPPNLRVRHSYTSCCNSVVPRAEKTVVHQNAIINVGIEYFL